jgi:hypothetical protein
MDKSNLKVKQFINNCKELYGKSIPKNKNEIETIAKAIDIRNVNGFSWKNMARAWGICESKIKGKETGSLRVLWYRSFKQYAMSVMKDDLDLDKANALLSQGLAELVRSGEYMYEDFAVEDFAYSKDFTEFIRSLNVIMFVEKASEFPKFQKSCEILGIKILLQGSGRPNFSSTEYIYTHFFNGHVDKDHPVRILTLTDFDYDGINPIAGGFVKQMKHYTPYVRVGRVGLESKQISKDRLSVDDALYEVKQDNKNKPKEEWMKENLFVDKNGRFLGAEVECNPFKFYYPLIWDALKETGVTYQDFINQRYIDIQPDARAAAKDIAIELLADDLEDIDNEIVKLNEVRSEMILNKMDEIKPTVLQVKNDPSFIRCQNHKSEQSIYDALKNQKKWSGGLQYGKQVTEFKNRIRNLLGV